MVERPRLTEKLARAVQRPLTLIAAPAGSGKTALLSGWAAGREAGSQVAWLALGPGANSRRLFWTEVLAALQRPDDALASCTPPAAARILGPVSLPALVSELEALPGPVVLVLDDFHEVDDPEVMRDLDTLLEHAPDRMRLVVATRADPSLRLQRLRIAGRLEEIRSADLAFTVAETEQLLKDSSSGSTGTICGCCGRGPRAGVAGLRLAALSLQGHPDSSASDQVRRRRQSRERLPDDRGRIPTVARHARLSVADGDRRAGERAARRRAHRIE